MDKKIILASTSPRRQELLKTTGLFFKVVASDYEEDMTLPLKPAELVAHLSLGKAQAVTRLHPEAIIIAADTVVVYQGKIFGKPSTPQIAKEMLLALNGNINSIITGFTVINGQDGEVVSQSMEVKIHFKNLSEQQIDAYIASGEPMDKAGAYEIQGLGSQLIAKIDGDRTIAIGLPLKVLLPILKNFGIDVPPLFIKGDLSKIK